MDEFSSSGVRIAYIDEAPTGADRQAPQELQAPQEPILLIHGFASTHAVNWVFPHWVKLLTEAGRRVIAFDNRGHGRSAKLYDPAQYHSRVLAADALALLDHLGIARADVMGYSLGARIAAFLAKAAPARARSIILGGLGNHLVDGVGLPNSIADAMEAPSADVLTDPTQKMFRTFAEATKSDLKALAACVRGSRQTLSEDEIGAIACPVLIAIGTKDTIAGNGHRLAAMFPAARAVDIPGRDHNLAVGDKVYKQAVLEFLAQRP
jgi:pimeloyl-ACP methyl ester carboxylesterase